MFFNRGDQAAISLLTGVLCTSRRGRVLIMFLIGRIALKQKAICFWQRRRGQTAKVLSGCGVLAVIWVIWMERNRTFEVYSGAEMEKFYKRVEFWAYLYWSMFCRKFKDHPISSILF